MCRKDTDDGNLVTLQYAVTEKTNSETTTSDAAQFMDSLDDF